MEARYFLQSVDLPERKGNHIRTYIYMYRTMWDVVDHGVDKIKSARCETANHGDVRSRNGSSLPHQSITSSSSLEIVSEQKWVRATQPLHPLVLVEMKEFSQNLTPAYLGTVPTILHRQMLQSTI